jgi:hypothetical protein
MKAIALWVLIASAALLLSGCPGYGTHMGWEGHGGHMNSSSMNGYHTGGY